MKTLRSICILLLISAMIFSCGKDNDEGDDNNIPTGVLGELGNAWEVKFDGAQDIFIELVSKENDVYTLKVKYGEKTIKTCKFGFTGNKVVDYVCSGDDLEQPFTMVEFDAVVGDLLYRNKW